LNYGDQGDEKSPSKDLFEKMVDKIKRNDLTELFAADQLAQEMKEGNVFVGFTEGDCSKFPPTFKVERNSQLEYDNERSPAWCDRVLWRSVPGWNVNQRKLGCATHIMTSDHKPVFAGFDIETYRMTCGVDDMLGECTVTFKELKALGLPKADIDGSADPYLVFTGAFIKTLSERTPFKSNTREPVWDPKEVPKLHLSINRKERLRRHFIMVAVMDHDQTKDDLMANGMIFLSPYVNEAGKDVPFHIDLFAGGLPAGAVEGVINMSWGETKFKPKVLPPNAK